VGLVEDEWIFNNLNFIKFRICNWLPKHLALCVCILGKFLYIQNFPYDAIMKFLVVKKT
jgi:hypothetical protein